MGITFVCVCAFVCRMRVNAVDVVMFGDRKVLAQTLEAREGGGAIQHIRNLVNYR